MISANAANRALTLLSGVLLMLGAWSFLHLPSANMLMVVFVFLTSAMLFDIQGIGTKIKLASLMAFYASAVQFSAGITAGFPFLQNLFMSALAFFTLSTLPNRQGACICLTVGYLGITAPGGFSPAIDRSVDIFIGLAAIAVATIPADVIRMGKQTKPAFIRPYPAKEAMLITMELCTGTLLAQLFKLHQGVWIMLTILFIHQAAQDPQTLKKLARNRIFSVPLGILAGGLYIASLCTLDGRFVYLVPLIGTAGFFTLYQTGNYFLFSLIFMMTMTITADLLSGTLHPFGFQNQLLSRTIASWIGIFLLISGEAVTEWSAKVS